MGELIVNGIKWGFIIACGVVFAAAILSLLNLLSSLTFGGVISEVFGIMSMCLPFDLSAILSAIGVSITAILAFLVAKKVYELTTEHVKV